MLTNYSVWVGVIRGTDAYMKIYNSSNNTTLDMVYVAVDGGAPVAYKWDNVTEEIPLFTGLTDDAHFVSIRVGPAFGGSVYFKDTGGGILRANGASPAFHTVETHYETGYGSMKSASQMAAPTGSGFVPDIYPTGVGRFTMTAFTGSLNKLFVDTFDGSQTKVMTGNGPYSYGDASYVVPKAYGVDAGIPPETTTGFVWSYSSGVGSLSIGADAAPTFPDLPRLISWGHSITFGAATSGPAGTNWPVTAANFGYLAGVQAVSGDTIADVQARIDGEIAQLTIAANDVAIVDLGRNDGTAALDATQQSNYNYILSALVTAGFNKVLCLSCMVDTAFDPTALNASIAALVAARAETNIYYLDRSAYTVALVPRADGVHPNAAGYAGMVELDKTLFAGYL